jgi:hypothetical protein
MYPEIDDVNPTDYSLLNNAIKFVATSDDATFASQVGDYFDLPVLADYYVFITMLFAIDNSSKNVIWGCYDSAVGKKLTLAVWDLEATVGQHWYDGNGFYHAPEIQPEKDLLNCRFSALNKNKLFMRLLGIPEFKRQVVYRYWQLRRSVLEPNNMIAKYKAVLDALETSGALARESERWSGSPDIYNRPLDFYGEFEYMSDWIRRRVVYLDNNDFAGRPGDVDNDGDITIGDVTLIIDYLNTGEYDSSFVGDPDADGDGKVNISDVIEIIDILLGH